MLLPMHTAVDPMRRAQKILSQDSILHFCLRKGLNMKKPLTFSKLWAQMKKLFLPWLIAAVLAGVAVLGINLVSLPERGQASATVSFSYEGIESGLAPNGNRFDPDEIRDPEIIRAAAGRIGLELTEEETGRIRDAMAINGSLPDGVIDRITKLKSQYEANSISVLSAQQIKTYFPSQYTVALRLADAGLDMATANRLLPAVLDAYRESFLTRYGYSTAVEKIMLGTGYSEYEYEGAVRVINNRLDLLLGYVNSFSAKDTTMFRSSLTGYSFEDLSAAIATVKSQDVAALDSYISSNNVSKEWKQQRDEYHYMIEETERSEKALEERIETLNSVIAGYAKTKTVVPGGSEIQKTSEEESGVATTTTGTYQVTQQSAMYDALIKRRIELQTELSGLKEEISLYRTRMNSISGSSTKAAGEYVESEIARIDGKIRELVSAVRGTVNDYQKKGGMQTAFEVLDVRPAASFPILRLIKGSLWDGIGAEAIVLGIFLLIALLRARGKKQGKAREALPSDQGN